MVKALCTTLMDRALRWTPSLNKRTTTGSSYVQASCGGDGCNAPRQQLRLIPFDMITHEPHEKIQVLREECCIQREEHEALARQRLQLRQRRLHAELSRKNMRTKQSTLQCRVAREMIAARIATIDAHEVLRISRKFQECVKRRLLWTGIRNERV